MKKLFFPAICLCLAVTTQNVSALSTTNSTANSIVTNADDRKVIKQEELPQPVTKAIAGDAYKGWTVKEAAIVTPVSTTTAGAADKKTEPYYEVTLTKEKETKTVKFQKDGTLLN